MLVCTLGAALLVYIMQMHGDASSTRNTIRQLKQDTARYEAEIHALNAVNDTHLQLRFPGDAPGATSSASPPCPRGSAACAPPTIPARGARSPGLPSTSGLAREDITAPRGAKGTRFWRDTPPGPGVVISGVAPPWGITDSGCATDCLMEDKLDVQ